MPRPSETALRSRARSLIEAMTERARWIYAIPRSSVDASRSVLEDAGFALEETDQASRVWRLAPKIGDGRCSFVLFDSADLDVAFVEATGSDAPPALAKLLEHSGFYAQSTLLGTALDVSDPEAGKALRTLAHMIVSWDEDWSDLFLLHLASPDPVARHEAALALTVAVMVARDLGPAERLLDEALRRETFPKLRATFEETIRVVQGFSGAPVAAAP